MSDAVKETKAQRVERLKRELNPWDAYADIQRFAREGWDSVPPEWFSAYFRWWGIYSQGDGVGAIGGKGGGRPEMAQGRGTKREGVGAAIAAIQAGTREALTRST